VKRLAALLALAAPLLAGGDASNVLVVINDASALSRAAGEYYVRRREIPLRNVCHVRASTEEAVTRDAYNASIAAPIARCLRSRKLVEGIYYIVTTAGVPLKIEGAAELGGDQASVDSELTLLYADLHGPAHATHGFIANPFFDNRGGQFGHPRFAMYLVTRLAGYDFPDIRGEIDRALAARNTGKFVIDMKSSDRAAEGDNWLYEAARQLPPGRVVLDESDRVLTNEKEVIAYAAWGSNDPHRKERYLGFQWLPGAIVTEYVSTNARTFARPPENWTLGNWRDVNTWFAGAPQTLTADYIHDGATGASGHVYEPYLPFTPRPDVLLPAWYQGRNLAESFWMSIPALSWQNVVIGDPLCSLGKP